MLNRISARLVPEKNHGRACSFQLGKECGEVRINSHHDPLIRIGLSKDCFIICFIKSDL